MTRQSHDQFAKEYLEELLAPLGTIKQSRKVKSEIQEIDVWFEPSSNKAKDTLWLRVLGKGATQKRAVEELIELPETNPFRTNLLEILASWRNNLELRDNLSSEEQEVIMNLSPAYLKQREEWKQEGKQEGKLEGKQEGKLEGKQEGKLEGQLSMIASLLEGRFGTLDSELSGLVEQIAQIPLSERTQLLLSLASLSREELILRVRKD